MGFTTKRTVRRLIPQGSIVAAVLLLLAFSIGAFAEPSPPGDRVEQMLSTLAILVADLEQQLDAVGALVAERLAERLDEALDVIEKLVEELDGSQADLTAEQRRERLTRLDLQLHRLIYLLEGAVREAKDVSVRARAEQRLDDLRVWLDSVIFDASFGMSAEEYEQLESAVTRIARRLTQRIADLARQAEPATRLDRLIEQLQAMLLRIDGLLLRPSRPAEGSP